MENGVGLSPNSPKDAKQAYLLELLIETSLEFNHNQICIHLHRFSCICWGSCCCVCDLSVLLNEHWTKEKRGSQTNINILWLPVTLVKLLVSCNFCDFWTSTFPLVDLWYNSRWLWLVIYSSNPLKHEHRPELCVTERKRAAWHLIESAKNLLFFYWNFTYMIICFLFFFF